MESKYARKVGGKGTLELRTSHQCANAGNQVDNLGLDTRVGAGAKGGVVGGRGEID